MPRVEGGSPMSVSRRDFLALGAAVVAPGLFLVSTDSESKTGVRWGLLIDTSRCDEGCTACLDACREENGWPQPKSPRDVQWLRKVELTERATGRKVSLPVMCQHCAEPPCVDVCPTGASFKRADGIVLVDKHTCIGCRYCMMACPYKARSFVHEPLTDQKADVPRGKGCVESCTLCVHRLDKGDKTTACAEACTKAGHGAIVFGDLNDPASEISRRVRAVASTQLRADLGLDPGVRYQGL
jgi:molybdopterin-containing oxidoreductase family iron-sulfur binding subunit